MIIIHTECDGASRATTRIQTTDALRVVAEDARDRDIIRMDEHSLIGKCQKPSSISRLELISKRSPKSCASISPVQ